MRTKTLAALALLSAVAVAGLPGTASARNGHFGGGGAHIGGAHFGGARFGGARFGGARFGGARFGGVRVAHFGGPRAIGTNWNRGWNGNWRGSWARPGWRGAAWHGGHRWRGRRGWGWGWPVAGVALGGWAISNYFDGYYDGSYDPADECYETARIWTPRGWRWRQVWVCG
jgi:hypothetical protein